MDNRILDRIDHTTFNLVGEAAASLSLPCYAVGGYVRDLFLCRSSKDIDFVSVGNGSGIAIARETARRLGRHAHVAVFKTYGTAQVKAGGLELEFVAARRESYRSDSRNPEVEEGTLDDDLSRRDFTINAMALSLNPGEMGLLIDRFGGLDDLRERVIRTPLDPDITFSDDPLRMMRAIRFATQLDFTIYTLTLEAIARNASRIKIITRERILTELNKIMLSPRPSIGWRLLDATGLLQYILPELAAMKGVQIVKGRGHKDNFDHTLQVLDNVAAASDKLWLRWAALLHDIAKPATKHWDDAAGWTFHNHNFIGAKMVELHMRPIALVEETVTDSAVRRLITDAGDDIDDLMLLCRADITSRNPQKVRTHLQNYQGVLEKIDAVNARDHLRQFQPPVDGQEIMDTFNLSPCATVGLIKSAIKDAILDGLIPNDHAAAFDFMLTYAQTLGLSPASGPSH